MKNKKITARLKRAEGQVRALAELAEKEKDCAKVITQFQAAKAALESAFAEYLEEHLHMCNKKKDTTQMSRIIKQITKK